MNGATATATKREGAMENKALEFAEKSLMLLYELESFVESVSRVINEPAKLRTSSSDYAFIDRLRQKSTIKGSINSVIEGLKAELPTIEIYDKRLALFIKTYEIKSHAEVDSLRSLVRITKEENLREFVLNFELVLQHLENITNKDVQEKLRLRLILIKRYFDEAEELRKIAHDLEDGEMLHRDISFFSARIKTYFEGGTTSDGISFKGLLKIFKDENLRAAVFGNEHVKRLLYLSQFLHRIEEQSAFIFGLVDTLEKAEQSGKWSGFLGRGGFYENIEIYAKKFREEFNNEPYARMLLNGKEKIGEQPHIWLNLVRNMQNFLKKLDDERNNVLLKVRDFLHEVFSNRINELMKSAIRVASDTNKSIINYLMSHEDMGFFKGLRDGLERIESVISSKWRKIKRQFEKLRAQTNTKYFEITPKLEEIAAYSDISREALALYRFIESNSSFVKHKDQLLSWMEKTGLRKSDILTLAFDLARIDDNFERIAQVKKALERKTEGFTDKMILDLKRIVREAIVRYFNLIKFIKTLNLQISTENIEQKLRHFIREEYRGDVYARA